MGLHSDLEIYKTVFELLKLVAKFCKHMNRDYRQILGGELRDHCLKITTLILRANIAQVKEPYLLEIIERKETAELLIRLMCDLVLISRDDYAAAIALTASIGKQANGWRTQQSRQTHEGQGHHDRTLF
jgi:hypothetical protein